MSSHVSLFDNLLKTFKIWISVAECPFLKTACSLVLERTETSLWYVELLGAIRTGHTESSWELHGHKEGVHSPSGDADALSWTMCLINPVHFSDCGKKNNMLRLPSGNHYVTRLSPSLAMILESCMTVKNRKNGRDENGARFQQTDACLLNGQLRDVNNHTSRPAFCYVMLNRHILGKLTWKYRKQSFFPNQHKNPVGEPEQEGILAKRGSGILKKKGNTQKHQHYVVNTDIIVNYTAQVGATEWIHLAQHSSSAGL